MEAANLFTPLLQMLDIQVWTPLSRHSSLGDWCKI